MDFRERCRASWLQAFKPVAHDFGCHLRIAVRSDVLRNAFGEHHVGRGVYDAEGVDATPS